MARQEIQKMATQFEDEIPFVDLEEEELDLDLNWKPPVEEIEDDDLEEVEPNPAKRLSSKLAPNFKACLKADEEEKQGRILRATVGNNTTFSNAMTLGHGQCDEEQLLNPIREKGGTAFSHANETRWHPMKESLVHYDFPFSAFTRISGLLTRVFCNFCENADETEHKEQIYDSFEGEPLFDQEKCDHMVDYVNTILGRSYTRCDHEWQPNRTDHHDWQIFWDAKNVKNINAGDDFDATNFSSSLERSLDLLDFGHKKENLRTFLCFASPWQTSTKIEGAPCMHGEELLPRPQTQ